MQISEQLTARANSLKPTDNSYQVVKEQLGQLPVPIGIGWENCVIGHIQHFGFAQVLAWAKVAASKNKPEAYFMTILRRQRYGK